MEKQLIQHIDDETFETTIQNGVVLVDFFAEWCGPCRMLTPILDALSTEFQDNATIAKLDVDQAPKTCNTFQITSVPTLILFKNGEQIDRFVGLKDLETLKKHITQIL